MSIVAESDAMAIQTLRIPRKRPGQALKDKRRLEGQCEDGEPKGTVRSREVLPAAEPKGRMRELLRAAVGAREEAFGFEGIWVLVDVRVVREAVDVCLKDSAFGYSKAFVRVILSCNMWESHRADRVPAK